MLENTAGNTLETARSGVSRSIIYRESPASQSQNITPGMRDTRQNSVLSTCSKRAVVRSAWGGQHEWRAWCFIPW